MFLLGDSIPRRLNRVRLKNRGIPPNQISPSLVTKLERVSSTNKNTCIYIYDFLAKISVCERNLDARPAYRSGPRPPAGAASFPPGAGLCPGTVSRSEATSRSRTLLSASTTGKGPKAAKQSHQVASRCQNSLLTLSENDEPTWGGSVSSTFTQLYGVTLWLRFSAGNEGMTPYHLPPSDFLSGEDFLPASSQNIVTIKKNTSTQSATRLLPNSGGLGLRSFYGIPF